jgi:hypothetical protein
MKMTQQDYEARAKRIDDGTATDDDRRLVELYEREGFARDGEGVASKLTATGTAEVVKGELEPAKKATARKRAGDKAQ